MRKLINPIEYVNNRSEWLPSLSMKKDDHNAILISIAISDLHFGALDPQYQYETLKAQFINKIKIVPFDVLYINGDIFDRKFMGNSDAIMYASLFIDECVCICRNNGATLVLLYGTESHDSDQYKIFYHYLSDTSIDIRIVENTRFEYIKGQRVLCIPEEYGMGEEYYNKFLKHSGIYDIVIMHGMLRGVVYEDNSSGLDSKRAPTFDIDDFSNCRGYILSGHVHTPGVYGGYFYYSGSPLRWRHGEEENKGYLVVLSNLATAQHYVHFEVVESLKYITINIDYLINEDPEKIISELNEIKQTHDISHLRIEISNRPDNPESSTIGIIKNYYRNNNNIRIKDDIQKYKKEEKERRYLEKYEEYDYLFDNNLNEYEILAKYINQRENNTIYITTDEIINILTEDI